MKLIACTTSTGFLARAEDTPADDKRRFQALTAGHTCVIGRKSWEELPDPVKRGNAGRRWIVITHHPGLHGDGWQSFPKVERMTWARYTNERRMDHHFLCGGAELYEQARSVVKMAYISTMKNQEEGVPKSFNSNFFNVDEWEDLCRHETSTHLFHVYRRVQSEARF